MVVLDIPLLFETEGHKRVDITIVVSAPLDVQRERVLARPGMSAQKLDAISGKAARRCGKSAPAPISWWTPPSLEHARSQVAEIVRALEGAIRKCGRRKCAKWF